MRIPKTTLSLLSFMIAFATSYAQTPSELPPWDLNPDCGNSITRKGVAAFTVGVSTNDPPEQNFTLGMMLIDDVVPQNGRLNITGQVDKYYHPSWHVDNIGNVFGVTMDKDGNTYVCASSNYSHDFNGSPSILKYGALVNGDPESLEAAGAIYKIDAQTGEASHFASLDQQEYNFQHISYNYSNNTCEVSTIVRETGPGLGNIAYHERNNLFYVTNFEDGGIYCLDSDGNLFDMFNPLEHDTGHLGPPGVTEMPYGIAVNPEGTKVFFGVGEMFVVSGGAPPARIYSIGINPDGSFISVTETLEYTFPGCSDPELQEELNHQHCATIFGCAHSVVISSLEFLPSGRLLVGTRSVVGHSIHSASSSELYPSLVLEEEDSGDFDYSILGILQTGITNETQQRTGYSYGGVSYYSNDVGEIDYVVTSSDMTNDNTSNRPHGVHVSNEGDFGAPLITPAAIISYGGISDQGNPEGIGGDVYVFKSCNSSSCCKGDVNNDGAINFGDIQPFVDILSSGTHMCEADMNSDGSVTFADIQPFVDLISAGGGSCSESFVGNHTVVSKGEVENAISKMYETLGYKNTTEGVLLLFPNPASDQLNVMSEFTINGIAIYNNTGSLLGTQKLSVPKTTHQLDIGHLSQGIYFLEIQIRGSKQTLKFVKE